MKRFGLKKKILRTNTVVELPTAPETVLHFGPRRNISGSEWAVCIGESAQQKDGK